jgi:hypothetical protein
MSATKQAIAGTADDRRRRLTDADRADIHDLHKRGWSAAKIARAMCVSSVAVGYVLNPARLQRAKDRLAERGGHYALYGKALRGYMKAWRAEAKQRRVTLADGGNVDKVTETR